jgi:hypothetical protein
MGTAPQLTGTAGRLDNTAMRASLPAILALTALLSGPADPPAPDAAPAPPAADAAARSPANTPLQRVIARVSRFEEVAGTVELEDAHVLVLRQLDGQVRSFPKGRLLNIVRLVDPAPGQLGTVFLRDGQRSAGTIIEDSFAQVVVEIKGVRLRFKREVVDQVILQPTLEERYRSMKESLRPGMANDHLLLCRWLVSEERYPLAASELEELLAAHPDLVDARRLLEMVRAQLALGPGGADPGAAPASDEPAAASTEPDRLGRLLTNEEINLIRVYEIDFDHPPKVAVGPGTIRSLISNYGASPLLPATPAERGALFRADAIDVVKLIFALRARELYGEIDVLTEPHALNLFRQRVHDTWLMNGCATSRCHGGPDGGTFQLHSRQHKDERARYTNLLILERLSVDPAWPLLNYEAPGDSLIIQYGLPRDLARRPHPDVPGWKPIFARGDDRIVDHAVEWLRSMMQPRPHYPIDYVPMTLENSAPPSPPQLPGAPASPPRDGR